MFCTCFQCFGRAVVVSPDVGYTKYLNLGQLFEGKSSHHIFIQTVYLS